MEKYPQERQVIHVHLKETDQHFYFGSVRAIYDVLEVWHIGVAAQTLYNKKFYKYENDKVVIRKGVLHQKKRSV